MRQMVGQIIKMRGALLLKWDNVTFSQGTLFHFFLCVR